jgi:hypothetical protein
LIDDSRERIGELKKEAAELTAFSRQLNELQAVRIKWPDGTMAK